jgi:3-oxoacyl-[acyl-carrier-protein] synthase I
MTPLVINGTGVCVPIGTRAWQAACGLQAKQSSFTRESMLSHADHRATISRLKAIEENCTGSDRLIRLAAPAALEALQTAGLWPLQQPVALFITLPQPLAELDDAIDAARFALELPRALEIAAEYLPTTVYQGGAVGGADALMAAYQYMDRYPQAQHVIVGGVECMLDQPTLQALYARKWLKVNDYSDGLIAGEGAAFVCLSREPRAPHYVSVFPPAFASEPASRAFSHDQLSGQALIQAYFAAAEQAHIPLNAMHAYWSDIDGSLWRGSEQASLSAALAPHGSLPTTRDPAAFTGDLGAAWLPFMLAMLQQMEQSLHHPLFAAPPAGHTAMQSVSGLDERVAAWVACWSYNKSIQSLGSAQQSLLHSLQPSTNVNS